MSEPDMNKLVGRQVSIMTKAHRRYTGKLSGWDQMRRVVWVDDVTGHGTEGRCAALGEVEQPPNPQIFETIEFNGKDLVDLRLIDNQREAEELAPKPRGVEPAGQTVVSRPPPQPQQDAWPPAPSQGYPPPPQQGGGFQGPAGPGGPYGYNQPMYQQDRWGPPPPMGGPPHGPPHGPPPPSFGAYGMYGGPQFPPYGAPGGPNFPPPGGRQFPQDPFQGYPPFPGQVPPPAGPAGQQQPFPPQQAPPPVELGVGRQQSVPFSNDKTVEPKALSTQAPPPAAQISASTSQPKPVEHKTPAAVQPPVTQAQAAAPTVPTGPKNAGKVVPAMPLTSKPAAKEPAKAPTAPAASAAPTRSAVEDATQAATAAVAAAMAKLPPLRQQNGSNSNQQHSNVAGNVDQLARKAGDLRINDNTTRAPRHPNTAESGFAPRGGAARGGSSRGRGGPRQEPRKVEVPKDDFDFESSNAKFNKQDLVKEVIAGDIHEAQASGPLEEEAPETVVPASSYNKKSSFFDDLSSEAKDRADGQASGQRYGREWRGEEQKRNVETFGQGSVDNGGYRGGMRGRGRGRGGYRGRGPSNYANGQPSRGRGGYQPSGPRQPAPQ